MVLWLHDEKDTNIKVKKKFNPVSITINNINKMNIEHIVYSITNNAMIELLMFLLIEETDVGHTYFNRDATVYRFQSFDNDDIHLCEYFDYCIYPQQIEQVMSFLYNDPKSGLEKLKKKIEIFDDRSQLRITNDIYCDVHLKAISESDLEVISSELFGILSFSLLDSVKKYHKEVPIIHFRVFL